MFYYFLFIGLGILAGKHGIEELKSGELNRYFKGIYFLIASVLFIVLSSLELIFKYLLV